jgi:hypothetical protein
MFWTLGVAGPESLSIQRLKDSRSSAALALSHASLCSDPFPQINIATPVGTRIGTVVEGLGLTTVAVSVNPMGFRFASSAQYQALSRYIPRVFSRLKRLGRPECKKPS